MNRREKGRITDSYQVAVNLGYGFRTVDDMVNMFGTPDLILLLDTFLGMRSLPIPQSYNAPFPVFKKFSLFLPRIPQISDLLELKDTVRVILPKPATGRQKAVEALFCTVLAVEKPDVHAFNDQSHPLKG